MGLATRQWIFLWTFYVIYLLFGACVFYHIEHGAETIRRAKELEERININELLAAFLSPDDSQIQNDILHRLSSYCNKPVTDHRKDEFVKPYQWTFYHSVIFAFIICSTLGYGNITPTENSGRYFLIIYAIVGMPVNIILYTYLGEYFGKSLTKVYRKYKAFKNVNSQDNAPQRLTMIGKISLTLVPAAVMLIFLPSCLFAYFEGWSYSVSVYYSFVTLTTIGFGDFVPTFQPDQEVKFGVYFIFYQIFVLVWFVFGLSYILMLIGFIARGMQSKKIARLEQQLVDNLKFTHNRLWNGVSKDVSYLRRILNEANIMQFSPIFVEQLNVDSRTCLTRSYSCPSLNVFDVKSPLQRRKRACSEICYDGRELPKQRADLTKNTFDTRIVSRHSETNLLRIDREKTFQQHSVSGNTNVILAQVVVALNNLNNELSELSPRNNVELISGGYATSQMNPKLLKRGRLRAKSLYPNHLYGTNEAKPTQLTWSGDNIAIQNYLSAQEKQKSDDAKPDPVESPGTRRRSIFSVFNSVFKRRNTLFNSIGDIEAVPEQTHSPNSIRKPSVNLLKARISNKECLRRRSIISNVSDQVFENTAGLIRSIENAQVKNAIVKHKASSCDLRSMNATIDGATHINRSPSQLHALFSATSKARPITHSQRWKRGRFSISRVIDDSAAQHRFDRRFSAVPTWTGRTGTNSSTLTIPPAWMRGQFKSTISPLALCDASSNASTTVTPTNPKMMHSSSECMKQ